MIRPGEIQNKARTVGVRDQQIEKDYILSWILRSISRNELLSDILAFKGGTVLKKIYFENYRFSEDLDFTLVQNDISNEQIKDAFEECFEFVREETNIPLSTIDNNEHKDGGINFYINYIGPLGGISVNKKVKVDISRSEVLAFETIMKDAFLGYSDEEAYQLKCYSLEEVLVEKLRSIMQRMQARDFYDIWYLLEIHEMDVDYYVNEFRVKCESKSIDPSNFHSKLEQRLPQYKGRWEKSISDQIQELPDFEQVERETLRKLRDLWSLSKP